MQPAPGTRHERRQRYTSQPRIALFAAFGSLHQRTIPHFNWSSERSPPWDCAGDDQSCSAPLYRVGILGAGCPHVEPSTIAAAAGGDSDMRRTGLALGKEMRRHRSQWSNLKVVQGRTVLLALMATGWQEPNSASVVGLASAFRPYSATRSSV